MLALAGLAVALQACIAAPLLHQDAWQVLHVLCSAGDMTVIACIAPHCATPTIGSASAIVLVYSIARYGALGRRWWLAALPAAMVSLTLLMAWVTPTVHSTHVAPTAARGKGIAAPSHP